MFSFQQIPKGLKAILISSVSLWILQLMPVAGSQITDFCSLVPSYAIGHFQIWRFITYIFMHDPHSPAHILFNMLALWMFGAELEEMWGTRRFLYFYLLSGIGAGLFSIIVWNTAIIGASGAILAILAVYACYFPDRTILLFFVFPVPVRIAVILLGAISLWGAWSGTGNIAYLTHLGGIAVGLLYYKYYEKAIIALKNRNRRTGNKPVIIPFRPKATVDSKEYFEREIDPILKKISEKGMNSLTENEKKKLNEISEKRP
jgi:membrane associated rhomboid family serine protease